MLIRSSPFSETILFSFKGASHSTIIKLVIREMDVKEFYLIHYSTALRTLPRLFHGITQWKQYICLVLLFYSFSYYSY